MAAYDLGAVLWPDTAQGRIPQGAIQVNLDNPLSKGLQIAYSPASGLLNLVDGRGFTQTGLTDAVNLKGRAIKNNATATSNISTRVISGQTDLTILFIGSRDSSTTTTGVGKVQDVVHTTVTALETNRWELNLGNGFGAVGDIDKPRFSQNSGGSATGLEMMIDGVLQSGCNPAPTVLVNKKIYSIICAGRGMQGDSPVALMGNAGGTLAPDATCNLVLVWNRYLSQDERISVTENIGQLLSFSSPALMWAPVAGVGVSHVTSGALTGAGSTIAGTAAHVAIHGSTGSLTGPGAAIAGTAARLRAFASSGALTGQGSAIAGAAARAAAGVHNASGALIGAGSLVAGSAAHIGVHGTTGALVGAGAVVAGTAARVAAAVTHNTSGALTGPGSVVRGQAQNGIIVAPVKLGGDDVPEREEYWEVRKPPTIRDAKLNDVIRQAYNKAMGKSAPAVSAPAVSVIASVPFDFESDDEDILLFMT